MTGGVLAVRQSRLRCAWCHDDLGPAVLTCVACRTLIHEECELDACPTLGCGSLAPWELVLPTREGPTALQLAVLGLLTAFMTAIGTVAVLKVAWPRGSPRAEGEAPRSARPAPGPDPAVPGLDPWFWWAPGTEVVVRTRLRRVQRLDVLSIGCGGSGPSVHRSWTRWELVSSASEVTFRLDEVRAHDVVLRVKEGPDGDEGTVRRPLDTWLEEVPAASGNALVTLPCGVFTALHRRAQVDPWDLPDQDFMARPVDPVEEVWTHPRVPVPLRRLVTWRIEGAPPEVTGSLESVIVSIRGQAAIR